MAATVDKVVEQEVLKTLVIEEKNGKNEEVVDAVVNNGEGTVDAGGFGNIPKDGASGGRLARMPVERDAIRYSSSHKRRGYCVIFNHRYFDRHTGLGERNGTDKDRDQIAYQFQKLGFEVKVHDNKTVTEIKDVIHQMAFETDHSDCDMFVLFFMSHGEQDLFWGRDAHFKSTFLFDNFTADQCKSLAGKPKLFFIQACRGDGLDQGVTLVRTHPSDETDSGHHAYKIPSTADFLISWSTVPGHFSWRNTTNGSWFVQSLVHVFEREAKHEDVLSMMTSVNRHMIVYFESNTPSQQHMHGKKQAASIVSTLMRKVYLAPKY